MNSKKHSNNNALVRLPNGTWVRPCDVTCVIPLHGELAVDVHCANDFVTSIKVNNCNHALTIANEIAGILNGDKWMPIETAPKDGTKILVFRPDAGSFTAYWSQTLSVWLSFGGNGCVLGPFTHWMPLPCPPERN